MAEDWLGNAPGADTADWLGSKGDWLGEAPKQDFSAFRQAQSPEQYERVPSEGDLGIVGRVGTVLGSPSALIKAPIAAATRGIRTGKGKEALKAGVAPFVKVAQALGQGEDIPVDAGEYGVARELTRVGVPSSVAGLTEFAADMAPVGLPAKSLKRIQGAAKVAAKETAAKASATEVARREALKPSLYEKYSYGGTPTPEELSIMKGEAPLVVPKSQAPTTLKEKVLTGVAKFQRGGVGTFTAPRFDLPEEANRLFTGIESSARETATRLSSNLNEVAATLSRKDITDLSKGKLSAIIEGRALPETSEQAQFAAQVRHSLRKTISEAGPQLGTKDLGPSYFPKILSDAAKRQFSTEHGPLYDIAVADLKRQFGDGKEFEIAKQNLKKDPESIFTVKSSSAERGRVLELPRDTQANGEFFYEQNDINTLQRYLTGTSNRMATVKGFKETPAYAALAEKLGREPATHELAEAMRDQVLGLKGRQASQFNAAYENLVGAPVIDKITGKLATEMAGIGVDIPKLGRVSALDVVSAPSKVWRASALGLSAIPNFVQGWRTIASHADLLTGGRVGYGKVLGEYAKTLVGKNKNAGAELERLGVLNQWSNQLAYEPLEGLSPQLQRLQPGLKAANKQLSLTAGKVAIDILDDAALKAKAGDLEPMMQLANDLSLDLEAVRNMAKTGKPTDKDYLHAAQLFISRTNPSGVSAVDRVRIWRHPVVQTFAPFMTMKQTNAALTSRLTEEAARGNWTPLLKMAGTTALTASAGVALRNAVKGKEAKLSQFVNAYLDDAAFAGTLPEAGETFIEPKNPTARAARKLLRGQYEGVNPLLDAITEAVKVD